MPEILPRLDNPSSVDGKKVDKWFSSGYILKIRQRWSLDWIWGVWARGVEEDVINSGYSMDRTAFFEDGLILEEEPCKQIHGVDSWTKETEVQGKKIWMEIKVWETESLM